MEAGMTGWPRTRDSSLRSESLAHLCVIINFIEAKRTQSSQLLYSCQFALSFNGLEQLHYLNSAFRFSKYDAILIEKNAARSHGHFEPTHKAKRTGSIILDHERVEADIVVLSSAACRDNDQLRRAFGWFFLPGQHILLNHATEFTAWIPEEQQGWRATEIREPVQVALKIQHEQVWCRLTDFWWCWKCPTICRTVRLQERIGLRHRVICCDLCQENFNVTLPLRHFAMN